MQKRKQHTYKSMHRTHAAAAESAAEAAAVLRLGCSYAGVPGKVLMRSCVAGAGL